ncbi:MAG: hypothetical protein ACTSUE_02875 [Promethearchaeota archaeon]
MELPLKDVEEFLDGVIDNRFKKEKKVASKLLQMINNDVKSVKSALDDLNGALNHDKDDLVTRAAIRFLAAINGELKKYALDLSERINHDVLKSTFDFLSKLFTSFNENGRKWLPKFGKDYKQEMKAVQLFMNKLARNNGKLDVFIREKYDKAREAEKIIEKIVRLDDLTRRVVTGREKISDMEGERDRIKNELDRLESELIELENDEQITRERNIFRELNAIKQKIQLEFSKIKKSIKKFEKAMQGGNFSPRYGVSRNDVKTYFKDPFKSVITEGESYPKLRAILENLLMCLEDGIQMKDDKREKTTETIINIKDNYSLKPLIEEYLKIQEKRQEILDALKEKGLSIKINEIKKKISDYTTQKSHFDADIEHEKENVVNTLKKMKSMKKTIENEINELSGDKLTILLSI